MSTSSGPERETEVLKLQVQTFYRLNWFIRFINNLDELLDLIMRKAEAAVGAEASCITLYEPSDSRLHMQFTSGEESEAVRHLSVAIEQGIMGTAAEKNTLLRVDDAQNDPRWDSSADKKTGFNTRSIMATPIRRRDQLLGVLEVNNKRGDPRFTELDGNVLQVVANQAAVVKKTPVCSSSWSSPKDYR
jgi:signal transduction protein with GAF and PtsI domain